MNLDLTAIKEVIRLADICSEASSKTSQRFSLAQLSEYLSDPAVEESRRCTQKLEDYMNSLDYDTILDLKALMLMGRDHDYRESDSYEVRFQDCRDYFARSHPDPEGKSLAVDYLASKSDLGQYLKDGLIAAGVRL